MKFNNELKKIYDEYQIKHSNKKNIDNFIFYLCDKSKILKASFQKINMPYREFYHKILTYLVDNDELLTKNTAIEIEKYNEFFETMKELNIKQEKTIDVFDVLIIILNYEKETYTKKLLLEYNMNKDVIFELQYMYENNDFNDVFSLEIVNAITDFKNKKYDFDLSLAFNLDDNLFKNINNNPENDIEKMKTYATYMNENAQKFNNVKLIGREKELNQIITVLSRKDKNNPILIGERGVGKTAIIEGIVNKIINKTAPKELLDKKIFSLDLGSMISGTKFRGEFEEKLNDIINICIKNKNFILFIDEIHMMYGLGASTNSSMDMSNILKPYLSRGEIKIIGSTTFEEAKQSIDKNKAILRRFQKIYVKEPTKIETIEILKGTKKLYEDFHNIKINNKYLDLIVDLSDKYFKDKHFPDKAIDIIDEIGAQKKAFNIENKNITKEDIFKIISEKSNIKIEMLEECTVYKNLENNLNQKIFGQKDIIDTVINKFFNYKSGLNKENKPACSFLSLGSSGTGKTELAKVLAENLNMNFLRYDMSEFSEESSVSKLFGANPSYIGYEEGGKLINDVKKHPNSVILFDEIEKANSKVINSFLSMLEEGEATAGDSSKAYFQDCIIFFSSNAGSKTHIDKTMGFLNNENLTNQEKNINKFFTPEFKNRLDAILFFNDLSLNDINNITNKFLNEIKDKLSNKHNITLNINNEVIENLSKNGYSKEFGARNIYRLIEKEIINKISKEILFGKYKKNNSINVVITDNYINII